MQGIEKVDDALRFAEKNSKPVSVMFDDAANMCFCVPYEEYASSMELDTYELLYIVHPDGEIE